MAKFDVNNVSVETLLGYVKDGTIAIPEIQRPFVWDTTKVRNLIDSLYREYPVGYIITWKSPDIKLKDGTSSEGKQILIDGQQRITALTAALLGEEVLDDNYKKKRIKIAFNIQTEEFQTCNPAIEKQEEWISDISEVMKSGFNTFEFISDYSKKFNLDANELSKKLTKLQSIKNIMIGRIELGSILDIETVTEIFVRINSAGVVLSQADFAMSKISVNEKYSGNDIRKTIDYFCHFAKTPIDFDNIKNNDIEFSNKEIFNRISWIKDKNEDLYLPSYVDVLRVAFTYKFRRGKLQDLVSLLSGRDFETREYKEEIVEDSYNKLYDGVKSFINQTNFERYVMILKSAGIIDESLVRSQNVLNFGYILFLYLREKNVSPETIERQVKRWVIMSIITQRYTSSPESKFDLDIRRLTESSDAIKYIDEELERNLGDAFWNSILVENFNTSVASSPYWKIYLIAQISLNDSAFLSKDMKVRTLVEGRGDVHHIFPKALLYKNGRTKSVVNSLANYTFITRKTNEDISDEKPEKYIPIYMEKQPGAIESHWIPTNDKELFKVENYERFLDERRKLLAESANNFLNSLLDNKVDKVEITDYANRKGVSNDINEDEKILELSYWMEENGLSGGEINYELKVSDNESIIIDLAWPDGIQNNLSEPVAIMIDEENSNISKVNLQKYRVFEDVKSFKDYIRNNYLEIN